MRRAARAMVLDPDDRVLLVEFTFPEVVVWATPGGGIADGETDEDALRRELVEEAGLETFDVGPLCCPVSCAHGHADLLAIECSIFGDAVIVDTGTYGYTGEAKARRDDGLMGQLTFDYLKDSGSAVVGDPDDCIATAKRYEAAGCDLLLCLVNPYKMKHEDVMESIELMGKHVLPAFS